MLDAIGVGSDRGAVRGRSPSGPARARRSTCRTACRSRRCYDHLAALAARNRHADDEVTFLGAGMYDHYVPALIDIDRPRSEFLTPVHAVPARDLPGRPAGDVRVPDGDLRADRPAGVERVACTRARRAVAAAGYLAKLENKRTQARRLAAACTRTRARRCATHAAGYGIEVVETPLDERGRHRRRGAGRRGRRRHRRRVRPAAELPRHRRGARARWPRPAKAHRRAGRRAPPTR